MATYLIGYDIHPSQGQTYDSLIGAIKSLGAWWHHLDSTWLVVSDRSVWDVRDQLQRHIWPNDELLVVRVDGQLWASFGFAANGVEWLKTNVHP
jgi:hypothetical protein